MERNLRNKEKILQTNLEKDFLHWEFLARAETQFKAPFDFCAFVLMFKIECWWPANEL